MLLPTKGVSARQTISTAAPISASRRASGTGNIDTPNSTGSEMPTQISWRQK